MAWTVRKVKAMSNSIGQCSFSIVDYQVGHLVVNIYLIEIKLACRDVELVRGLFTGEYTGSGADF
jgi:hypothetical protein